MTKPGEAHARLQKLVGRWSGDETLYPAPWDPAGGPATAVVENRLVLNGLAVVQEYQQSRHGVNNFAGHAVFWWDPAARQHVMTWFDAMSGTATEYRGGFDGDVLRLSHAMPQGGHSRCSFNCGEPDHTPSGWKYRRMAAPGRRRWKGPMPGSLRWRHVRRRCRRPASPGAAPRRPRPRRRRSDRRPSRPRHECVRLARRGRAGWRRATAANAAAGGAAAGVAPDRKARQA